MNEKLKLFGKRIAELRVRKNITQEGLAELIGYSPNHISKLESARTNPSFDLIIKIADALRISPQELFNYDKKNQRLNDIIYSIKRLNTKEQKFISTTIHNLKILSE